MVKKIGIIADDLTGANDAGVQLAKKGFAVTVAMNAEKGDSNRSEKPDVLVIDTDSRAKTPKAARENVAQAATLLQEQGYAHVYKKVDSTLRGNLAAELSELANVYQPDVVVFAPAFPKLKRTTINGNHYVNDVLISETEFGRDPKTPVTTSDLAAILKTEVQEEITLLDLATIRSSLEVGVLFIKSALKTSRWFVCDAKTENDLERVAELFAGLNKMILWSGSGGLIEYLPDVLNISPVHEQTHPQMEINKTLLVSGSLSQVTKKQLEALRTIQTCGLIELNPVELVSQTLDMVELLQKVNAQSEARQIVVFVDSTDENRYAAKEAGEKDGLDGNQVSERIAVGLGNVARFILERVEAVNGLILTGGDTAKAVCSTLRANEMQLVSEVEAGLPLGRIASEERTFWTVTKAGGFGNEHSLVGAVNYMTGEVEQHGK